MANFGYGIKILFRIWRDTAFAGQVKSLEEGKLVAPSRAKAEPAPAPAPAKKEPRRSEALTLLSALQREGRLVDFLKEPIAAYTDAQVGAAARDIHKGCASVVERMFALQPLAAAAEGSSVEVPKGFDPAQYRLTGNAAAEPPLKGALCHAGWKASKCELPEWTGSDASAAVVAPMEVELK